jgi:Xaa-Pro aminopeptidase
MQRHSNAMVFWNRTTRDKEAEMNERAFRGGNYAAELQAPEVYRERREQLSEAVGQGTIVIWGAGDERGYGDVGTFRQDASFFYLTGIELPNAVLVLRPEQKGQKDREILFLPPRNQPLELWTGPKWGPGEQAAEALGFARVLSIDPSEKVIDARRRPVPGFVGRLQTWLAEGDDLYTIYTPVPVDQELPPSHRLIASLRDRTPSFAVRDVGNQIARMRGIKDDGELILMHKAIDATIAGQRAIAGVLRAGVTESELDGVAGRAFRAHGAEGLAFPTIVGSGFSGTVLHYDQNRCTCADGDLVVVDIGARYGYYCGDLTRTYPVGGAFSERQRAIYDLVLAAHDRAAEEMRPGITMFELRRIVYNLFEESELRDSNGERLGQHFIHGLGHPLGLEAHDPGSDEARLEPGMVVTNEPGLYLQQESLGVRIENDFLLTRDGCENLSDSLPVRAEEIEAMVST